MSLLLKHHTLRLPSASSFELLAQHYVIRINTADPANDLRHTLNTRSPAYSKAAAVAQTEAPRRPQPPSPPPRRLRQPTKQPTASRPAGIFSPSLQRLPTHPLRLLLRLLRLLLWSYLEWEVLSVILCIYIFSKINSPEDLRERQVGHTDDLALALAASLLVHHHQAHVRVPEEHRVRNS